MLALAANTSFGGLRVLASLLTRKNYLPHLYAPRDDRQVFASGIWTLAILSGTLLLAVGGNTLTLIPLYAIGVFTGFTLSQGGLVVCWRRTRPLRWRYRASLNGLGAAVTAVATVVFLATKSSAAARARNPSAFVNFNGSGRAGTPACRCGCCGPNTLWSPGPSWPSSTSCAAAAASRSSC